MSKISYLLAVNRSDRDFLYIYAWHINEHFVWVPAARSVYSQKLRVVAESCGSGNFSSTKFKILNKINAIEKIYD